MCACCVAYTAIAHLLDSGFIAAWSLAFREASSEVPPSFRMTWGSQSEGASLVAVVYECLAKGSVAWDGAWLCMDMTWLLRSWLHACEIG